MSRNQPEWQKDVLNRNRYRLKAPLQMLLFAVVAATTTGAAPRYEWKQGNERYYAAERGVLIELVEVNIFETSDPFNTRAEPLLLQPCGSAGRVQPDAPPCWPEQERERTQELLASLYSDAPDYRGKPGLLRRARYLNRDIGTFRRAWIIGTNPLAVAFLEGPPDQIPPDTQRRMDQLRDLTSRPDANATTRPTTRPGYIEIVTRSGEVVPVDLRRRDARLVTHQELRELADVILLYPENMPLRSVGERVPDPPRVKVFHLREPQTLESVMRMMTQPGELQRQAEKIEEAPVLLHPDQPSPAAAATQPASMPGKGTIEYGIAAAKVFYAQALFRARQTHVYATEARGIEEKDRAEVLRLIDDYKRQVREQFEQIRADLPRASEIVNRAASLADQFEQEVLDPWLEAHPDVQAAIERQETIVHLMIDDLLEGGGEVVAAAQRAGLDQGAQRRAKEIVQEAFDNFQKYAQGLATWQEAAARTPEDSAFRLGGISILADTEMFKLESAQRVRQKLRELIPAERHEAFDEELMKLGEN